MEHLVVRFAGGLPRSIQRLGKKGSFSIPKVKRLQTLQLMNQNPQHVIKKGKTLWEVIGSYPNARQRGGNAYNSFLRSVSKVLAQVPGHDLGKLPVTQLQKHPQIKDLYDRHFKGKPEVTNYRSILNAVTSDLLNYDNTTGAVRESIADVRQKNTIPPSTVPLEITRENDFDRMMLIILHPFLAQTGIPELFLKSNYFTLRPQLLQLFHENSQGFRGEVERVRRQVEEQVQRDYRSLVNQTNRIYISRYPFERIALQVLGLHESTPQFSAFRNKLENIKRISLTIPGSTPKFLGLRELSETFARSPEARLMNLNHFMQGVQTSMTNDETFVSQVLKNRSRIHSKVMDMLKGNSL